MLLLRFRIVRLLARPFLVRPRLQRGNTVEHTTVIMFVLEVLLLTSVWLTHRAVLRAQFQAVAQRKVRRLLTMERRARLLLRRGRSVRAYLAR